MRLKMLILRARKSSEVEPLDKESDWLLSSNRLRFISHKCDPVIQKNSFKCFLGVSCHGNDAKWLPNKKTVIAKAFTVFKMATFCECRNIQKMFIYKFIYQIFDILKNEFLMIYFLFFCIKNEGKSTRLLKKMQ